MRSSFLGPSSRQAWLQPVSRTREHRELGRVREDRPMHEEVAAILAARFPSYQEPLRQVWTWNREATVESLRKGEELARGLKSRYPNVLQVCYELSFSLVRQKRRHEAISELQVAARNFPILDEDCLSLRGRCHKDEGDDLLSQQLLPVAQSEYQSAEECYQKAY